MADKIKLDEWQPDYGVKNPSKCRRYGCRMSSTFNCFNIDLNTKDKEIANQIQNVLDSLVVVIALFKQVELIYLSVGTFK
jgi:glutamate formiminotransferase